MYWKYVTKHQYFCPKKCPIIIFFKFENIARLKSAGLIQHEISWKLCDYTAVWLNNVSISLF